MSPLAWKDQYNIGHYQIDNEHKKLIALANKVMDFSNNGEDKDKINKVLNALSDYVKIHFRNEEKYMEHIKYKGIAHQRRCHAEIICRLNAVSTQSNNLDDLVHALKRLMVVWVIEHIIHEDSNIAPGK